MGNLSTSSQSELNVCVSKAIRKAVKKNVLSMDILEYLRRKRIVIDKKSKQKCLVWSILTNQPPPMIKAFVDDETNQTTPLLAAVAKNNIPITTMLLDDYGWQVRDKKPLQIACEEEFYEMARLLLKKTPVEVLNEIVYDSNFYAFTNTWPKFLNIYHYTSSRTTLLEIARRRDNARITSLLLQHNCTIHLIDTFLEAVQNEQVEIIQCILEKKPEIVAELENFSGCSYFVEKSSDRTFQIATLLLKHGARPEIFFPATVFTNSAILRALYNHNPNCLLNASDILQEKSALFIASKEKAFDEVRFLLEKLPWTQAEKEKVLFWAGQNRVFQILQIMMETNSVDTREDHLCLAIINKDWEKAKSFLHSNVFIDIHMREEEILRWAVQGGNPEIVLDILQAGADCLNGDGEIIKSAVELASTPERIKVVEHLLRSKQLPEKIRTGIFYSVIEHGREQVLDFVDWIPES